MSWEVVPPSHRKLQLHLLSPERIREWIIENLPKVQYLRWGVIQCEFLLEYRVSCHECNNTFTPLNERRSMQSSIDAMIAVVKWKPEKIQAGLELEPLILQLAKWNLPLVTHNINIVKCHKPLWLKNKVNKWISNDLEVAPPLGGSSSTQFLVELEFGNVGFWGQGKTRVPRETPLRAKGRTNNKLNPHVSLTPGLKPTPHWFLTSIGKEFYQITPKNIKPWFLHMPVT